MYNCKYCGRECKNLSGLHKHERHCKNNPCKIPQPNPVNQPQELYCSYCGRLCKNLNSLRNHEISCRSNPNYNPQLYTCEFCGRTFSRLTSFKSHVKVCKNNPNRVEGIYRGWNKGLTKETCESIKISADRMSARLAAGEVNGCYGLRGNSNYSTRPEVKAKISKTMMGNHNNDPNKTGRGKKGWYKGFYCSSTYELAFLIYCLDNKIPVERCPYTYEYMYENKKHRYYPDFIINNTIVEVKGFYTEQVRAKTEAVKDRPIIVLYKKDLKEVFDYIKFNYRKIVDKNIHELYESNG